MRPLLRRTQPRRSAVEATEARIRAVLAEVAPVLHLDAAQLELSAWDPDGGVALLAVRGACPHCDLSVATFRSGLEARLQRSVPEVREVRLAER